MTSLADTILLEDVILFMLKYSNTALIQALMPSIANIIKS